MEEEFLDEDDPAAAIWAVQRAVLPLSRGRPLLGLFVAAFTLPALAVRLLGTPEQAVGRARRVCDAATAGWNWRRRRIAAAAAALLWLVLLGWPEKLLALTLALACAGEGV